jgi:hypothetical protein
MRLQAEFQERYALRSFARYGDGYLKAVQAADIYIEAWLTRREVEVVALLNEPAGENSYGR